MKHIHSLLVLILCATLSACGGGNAGNGNSGNSGSGGSGGSGGSTSTPAFVQAAPFPQPSNGSPVVTTATYTVTFPNNVTSGDFIVLPLWWNYPTGGSVVSVTDSGGDEYRQGLEAPFSVSENNGIWIYYATVTNVPSGPFTVTVEVSQSTADGFSMVALEYSGLTALDVTSTGSGPLSTNPYISSSGNVVTHEANELIVGVSLTDDGQCSTAAGAGFTMRYTSPYFAVEDKIVSSVGTYNAGFFYSGDNFGYWTVGMATFY